MWKTARNAVAPGGRRSHVPLAPRRWFLTALVSMPAGRRAVPVGGRAEHYLAMLCCNCGLRQQEGQLRWVRQCDGLDAHPGYAPAADHGFGSKKDNCCVFS